MVFKGKRRRRFWSPKSSSSLLLQPNLDVVPILINVVPKGIVRRIRQRAVYPEATLYWNQKSTLTTTAASGLQFQCRIVAEAKAFCCGGRGTRTGWEGRREKGNASSSFKNMGWERREEASKDEKEEKEFLLLIRVSTKFGRGREGFNFGRKKKFCD